MSNKQVMRLCINGKGEKIDPDEFKIETQQGCDNSINFCCTAVVPDGFVLDFETLTSCVDFSDLSCCLEARETTCNVPNPCNGTLTCPVEIQAVRLVGCARLYACSGPVSPVSGACSQTPGSCTINCETTTCVNQILAFTCGKTPPCEPCFEPIGSAFRFTLATDQCGRQILMVQGAASVRFIGCDC